MGDGPFVRSSCDSGDVALVLFRISFVAHDTAAAAGVPLFLRGRHEVRGDI